MIYDEKSMPVIIYEVHSYYYMRLPPYLKRDYIQILDNSGWSILYPLFLLFLTFYI